jgi:hypothetical protein
MSVLGQKKLVISFICKKYNYSLLKKTRIWVYRKKTILDSVNRVYQDSKFKRLNFFLYSKFFNTLNHKFIYYLRLRFKKLVLNKKHLRSKLRNNYRLFSRFYQLNVLKRKHQFDYSNRRNTAIGFVSKNNEKRKKINSLNFKYRRW